ncbi:UxaA family hydrolase [Sedimentitalea sp. XS_ASV28]|uniref:UxaA family hydrolase n=1 Tax=Sedimentitalea sp. XS_ASV28 TaxID=3241296 RepID=UPI003519032F
MTTPNTHKLLLLSDTDNVLVALGPVDAGPNPVSDGTFVDVKQPVTLGQKIARVAIARGEKIRKYGVPIGSASVDISPGDHVHVHNIQSDYTATHSLTETAGGTHA